MVFTQSFGTYSRLSGHAEAIYFLLAPLYTLWPDPRLLLIIQSVLYALGALPVYRITLRQTTDQVCALGMALIYLFYPVAQTAVLFDFHGDTLAMPLLLFALDALDARIWRRYALFIALALLCKVYVAVAVIGIGAYLFLWGGQRRAGLLTITVAIMYGVVVFFGVRPFFAINENINSGAPQNYLAYYFGELETIWATADDRAINAVLAFGPIFLAG